MAAQHQDHEQTGYSSPLAPVHEDASVSLAISASEPAQMHSPVSGGPPKLGQKGAALAGEQRAADNEPSEVKSTTGSSSNMEEDNAQDKEQARNGDSNELDEQSKLAAHTKLGSLITDTVGGVSSIVIERLTPSTSGAAKDQPEEAGDEQDPVPKSSSGNETVAAVAPSSEKLEGEEASEEEPPEGEEAGREAGGEQPQRQWRRGAQAGGAQLDEREEDEEQLRVAMETYQRWKATADDLVEMFSRKLLPVLVEHAYDVDSGTAAGLLTVWNGVRALKPWALKLLDSWTKLSPGVLVGTQSDFGDFDECLNVFVDDPSGLAANNPDYPVEVDPETGLKSTSVVGRYCLADVEFPKPPRRRQKWARTSTNGAKSLAPQVDVQRPANKSQFGQLLDQLFRSKEPLQSHQVDGNRWAPIELRRPLLNFSQTILKETIFVETGNFFHMLYVDPIRVGMCLTNKIEPENFAKIFNKLLEEFRITINFRARCVTKYERPKWTSYQLVSAYILLAFCGLLALSTVLDFLETKLAKFPPSLLGRRLGLLLSHSLARCLSRNRPLLTSFSLIRNTKKLFKQQPRRTGKQAGLPEQSADQETAQTRSQLGSNMCQAGGGLQSKGAPMALVFGSNSSAGSGASNAGDSSVECSPSIERRTTISSSIDAGSSAGLLISSGSNSKLQLASSHSDSTATTTETNGRLDSSQTLGAIDLRCLHGIRVITMTWMIVNHTYMFGGFFVLWAYRRLIDIAEWPKSFSFQLVLNGWLTVETYFFLSALIIVLNVMPLLHRKQFNYLAYIIHRLLRLMPAYIGLVCLNFLWPLISSGPVWLVKGHSFVQYPCENYLWTNFLFINNWIWPEKQVSVHLITLARFSLSLAHHSRHKFDHSHPRF